MGTAQTNTQLSTYQGLIVEDLENINLYWFNTNSYHSNLYKLQKHTNSF